METISNLFDKSKDIYRSIEKVISYNALQEERLKAEISEYVVTANIEEQFEKLLSKMQVAMESGGQNEVGVWVSGFYGSGKSSFTKYLGMALDERVSIDGISFMQYLQDRLHKPQTRALLSTVSKRFPAAVVFLDLASEMLAGATMEDVSTVLYFKVLQWAGYSRNLKVAALERKMQKDGRYKEFQNTIKEQLGGVEWASVQNDPLVVDSIIPDIAHQMYPEFFKTSTSFSAETTDFITFENERVQEMIDIVKETSGKEYIIFIIDEVGQYIGSKPSLILNMDGLAKNLKNIGDGKVWIIGTAQQTLTEDDPRAAFNSPELYKLKDRFPIQMDLESSDIKEICYRRLLGKSPEGEAVLGSLFDQHGQSLRFNTRLQDAKYYDSDFARETFINLYPFLPAHFDILLHLLGALAKSTGGIGLRSAIKVVQDILIEAGEGHFPAAEQSVGWLANTVTLYDALEKDIRRAFTSIHRAVVKVSIIFHDSRIHQDIAKTVAVLQILGNMPVTIQNVASLMHSSIEGTSVQKEVEKAVNELLSESRVPFGEQDGNLCFFSEKLNDIEQERIQLALRSIDVKRIVNEALRDMYSPLPSTKLNGSLVVTTGLKIQSAGKIISLAGDKEAVQTIVEIVEPGDYDTARNRLMDESRLNSSKDLIYLLGRLAPEIAAKSEDIFRCQEICQKYRNDPDQDVKKYCSTQTERATRLNNELQQLFKNSLESGSFIFRGQITAVESLDQGLLESSKKHLAEAAAQIFDHYGEAPVRVDTTLAEKFLRAGNLTAITSQIDPLGLVQIKAGTPHIMTDHKALISIRDYIDRFGNVEGKRLLEHFGGTPYGWSQDTLRYLVAALLLAGEIKLKVSGREIKVNGQQAIEALKNNNAFKNVGVALREERPPMEVLARAAGRLTDLLGEQVLPLEDEISKTAAKHMPQFQVRYAPLGGKLSSLGITGTERVQSLNQEIADLLFTDASDAPQRLGGEESSLFESLKWAAELAKALEQGLEITIGELVNHRKEILTLPDSGVPGQLRKDLAQELDNLAERLGKDDFYRHTVDLNTMLTTIKAASRDAALKMAGIQQSSIKSASQELIVLPAWQEFTQEEQNDILAQLDSLKKEASADLAGLKDLINQEFVIHSRLREMKEWIIKEGRERQHQRLEEEKKVVIAEGKKKIQEVFKLPRALNSTSELDELIKQLQNLKNQIALYSEIEVTLSIED